MGRDDWATFKLRRDLYERWAHIADGMAKWMDLEGSEKQKRMDAFEHVVILLEELETAGSLERIIGGRK